MKPESWTLIIDAVYPSQEKWAGLITAVKSFVGKDRKTEVDDQLRNRSENVAELTADFTTPEQIKFKVTVDEQVFEIAISSTQTDPHLAILDSLKLFYAEEKLEITIKTGAGATIGYSDADKRKRTKILQSLKSSLSPFLLGAEEPILAIQISEENPLRISKKDLVDELIKKDVADETSHLESFYEAQAGFFKSVTETLDKEKEETDKQKKILNRKFLIGSIIVVAAILLVTAIVLTMVFFPPAAALLALAGATLGPIIASNMFWIAVYSVIVASIGFKYVKALFNWRKKTSIYKSKQIKTLKKQVESTKEDLEKEKEQTGALIKLLRDNPEELTIKGKEMGLAMAIESRGIEILAKYLASGKLRNLKTIEISDCTITAENIAHLTAALTTQTEENGLKISKIVLTGSTLGPGVIEKIEEALSQNVTIMEMEIKPLSDEIKRQLIINNYLHGEILPDAMPRPFADEPAIIKAALAKLSDNFEITHIPHKIRSDLEKQVEEILEQNKFLQQALTLSGDKPKNDGSIKAALEKALTTNPKRAAKFILEHNLKAYTDGIKEETLQEIIQEELMEEYPYLRTGQTLTADSGSVSIQEPPVFLNDNYELAEFKFPDGLSPPPAKKLKKYVEFICARNTMHKIIIDNKDKLDKQDPYNSLTDKQITEFINACKELKGNYCKQAFVNLKNKGITPAQILRAITPAIGTYSLPMYKVTFDCKRLKELVKDNPKAFTELFTFAFKVNETPENAEKKANLIAALLQDPLLSPPQPDHKLETIIYWAMASYNTDGSPSYDLKTLIGKLKPFDSILSPETKKAIQDISRTAEETPTKESVLDSGRDLSSTSGM